MKELISLCLLPIKWLFTGIAFLMIVLATLFLAPFYDPSQITTYLNNLK